MPMENPMIPPKSQTPPKAQTKVEKADQFINRLADELGVARWLSNDVRDKLIRMVEERDMTVIAAAIELVRDGHET